MTLSEFFDRNPKVALAFSGGVDSAYLLYEARRMGCDVRPYFVRTPFQPAFELDDARTLAPELTVLELDILSCKDVEINAKNRCYHCKKAMLSYLKQQALSDGYDILIDGTNASDRQDDRPGMVALQELRVLSPLRLCGLTKDQIRELSHQAGLFTWDKPAYSCLATRIPTGTAITEEALKKIEQGENALFALGYKDFRIRLLHGAGNVQLPRDQFPRTAEQYTRLLDALKPYFDQVLLDLSGR